MIAQNLKWLTAAATAMLLTGCPADQQVVESASTQSMAAVQSFPEYTTKAAGPHFDAQKIDTLESRMAKFVTDGHAKGIATLLVKDGKVISHMQTGARRVADSAPIETDTILPHLLHD